MVSVGTPTVEDMNDFVVDHHREGLVMPITKKEPCTLSRLAGKWRRKMKQKALDEPDTGDVWQRPDKDNSFRVSFAELQRMRLRKIQCRLVRHVADMRKTGKESENWETDLEAYSQ
jgi:hypothetical protein